MQRASTQVQIQMQVLYCTSVATRIARPTSSTSASVSSDLKALYKSVIIISISIIIKRLTLR